MSPTARLRWDVVVDLKAEGRYARVARTAAATCAVLEGFDVDQLGDVRLLVDEVFVALVDQGAQRIELRIAVGERRLGLELIGHHDDAATRRDADAGFLHTVAGALATDVVIELDRTPPRFAATMAAS